MTEGKNIRTQGAIGKEKNHADIFCSHLSNTGLLLLSFILVGFVVMPALAIPNVEFSPGGAGAGGWSYSPITITFHQAIRVDGGLGNPSDSLVGALVYLPDLSVSGIPGGPYVLTPVTGIISIKSPDGTVTYLSGTLGLGDLVPVGTTALCYTTFDVDITSIIVNNTIGSDALAAIADMNDPKMDFELTFQGAPSKGFKWMLDNNKTGSDGFSGAMTVYDDVPEPATICLLAAGSLVFIRKNNKKSKRERL